MSSDEASVEIKKSKKSGKKSQDKSSKKSSNGDYVLKPDSAGSKISTADWPLLLKNFDKLNIRTSHFTPIPAGH